MSYGSQHKRWQAHLLAGIAAVVAALLVAPTGRSAAATGERGFEMVSPSDKNGSNITLTAVPQAAADGNALVYPSEGAFGETAGAGVPNLYQARRGSDTWHTTSLAPPQQPGPLSLQMSPAYVLHALDLRTSVLLSAAPPLVAEAPPDPRNLYIRDNVRGVYDLVTAAGLDGPPDIFNVPTLADGTGDARHVIFESDRRLTREAPGGVTSVYEYDGGVVRLVSDLPAPNGGPALGGAVAGAGALLGADTERSMSEDGSIIYFSTLDDQQLYMRTNGAETVKVSASRLGVPDPAGPQPAAFVTATQNGHHAFFTSREKLTLGSTASTASANGDLYRWDAISRTLIAVAPNPDPSAVAGTDVLGMVGASEDGSIAYFVARGRLTDAAIEGAPNLYVATATGVRFIGTLADDDLPAWTNTARDRRHIVTADGVAMFVTRAPLVPAADGRAFMVYRYTAGDGELVCASCPQDGRVGSASASLYTRHNFTSLMYVRRNLTSDGRRIFFETAERLVDPDINGRQDVYEWHDGVVGLISTGQSDSDSFFVDADESGESVFFMTRERISNRDWDDLLDVYVARFDARPERVGVSQPECRDDRCQGQLVEPPLGDIPGTSELIAPPDMDESPEALAAFRLRPILRAQRRAWVRTGTLRLTVQLSQSGAVTARATLIGASRRAISTAGVNAVRAGVVSMALQLPRGAPRRLDRIGRARVRLAVAYSKSTQTVTRTLRLQSAREGSLQGRSRAARPRKVSRSGRSGR